MTKQTRTLIFAAAITSAVALLVEIFGPRVARKVFVNLDDMQKCLGEAKTAELRNELAKRDVVTNEVAQGR